MRVHIVGAGPTGMSIAWELLNFTNNEVIIYDKKPSAGGSWWEPHVDTRDLHAPRSIFNNAFINTRNIFKEMNIDWNEIFINKKDSVYGILLKTFNYKDYWALLSLSTRVLYDPNKYKKITLKEALGTLSNKGRRLIETLSYAIDGVNWETISAFEFVQSFNQVGLSMPQTQRVSGKIMSDAMQKALELKGASFVFNTSLEEVKYRDNGFTARFSNSMVVEDGVLIMCIDHDAAPKLIKDNWGPVHDKLTSSTYECINILLDYDEPVGVTNTLELAMNSKWTILPVTLEGGKTVSCVICNLTEEILTSKPETLKMQVLQQLKLPTPSNIRIGWGSHWDGTRWRFSQSSGVLSTKGQIPFYGRCPYVAMCGMMSERNTPYASIEAAVEVARTFCNGSFGTRPALKPILITDVLMLLIVFILILMYK